MISQWMRTSSWPTRHYVTRGRLACGKPVDAYTLLPADNGPRCRTCCAVLERLQQARAAERERQAARARHAVVARTPPEPGTVFAGPDPLVALLRRYERGQL